MPTLEQRNPDSTTPCAAPMPIALRQRASTGNRPPIELEPGKHSIGSGPRCSIRLAGANIHPLHCLVVIDAAGACVRRWASNALLNGQPFDEAPLCDGDVLSVGSVELEVLGGESRTADEATEDAPPQPTAEPATEQEAADEANTSDGERSPELLAALRQQRDEFTGLLGRLDSLEAKVASAIAESSAVERAASVDDLAYAIGDQADPANQCSPHDEIQQQLDEVQSAMDMLEPQLKVLLVEVQQQAEEREYWLGRTTELDSRLSVCESQLAHPSVPVPAQPTTAAPADDHSTAESGPPSDSTQYEQLPAVQPESDRAESEIVVAPVAPTGAAMDVDSTPPADRSTDTEARDAKPIGPIRIATDAELERPVSVEADVDTDVGPILLDSSSVEADPAAPASVEKDPDTIAAEWLAEVTSETAEAAEPAAVADNGEDLSYIDRYSHLFAADDAAGEPNPPEGQSASRKGATPTNPLAAGGGDPLAVEPPAADDTESLELYMAKMMQRLRGDSELDVAVPSPPLATSSTAFEPETSEPFSPSMAIPTAPNGDGDALETPLTPSVQPAPLRVPAPAPERRSDFEEFRRVANQSARHAIGVHSAQILRRKSRTRFLIASLAAATTLWLGILAPGWDSFEFLTASVAFLAAVLWGHLTFRALVEAAQVGAFDDLDSDFTPLPDAHTGSPFEV